MHYVLDQLNQCTGCTACRTVCTKNAVSMTQDPAQRCGYVAVIDDAKCTDCGACRRICPVQSPKDNENAQTPEVYAVSADPETLKGSASGGAFTLLAKTILAMGGCVIGAAYRDDLSVAHRMIESEDELPLLQRSKYVQSDMNDIISQIRLLPKDRKILFVGTPCQTAGVRACCPGRENLYLVDLYCGHCPPAGLFARYLAENFAEGSISSYDFRTKQYGWVADTATITLKDGTQQIVRGYNDDYQKSYHSHLSMREVCENCRFASFPRQGDLSIADFWWIEESRPDLKNPMGTSAVLVNNAHGRKLFEAVFGAASASPGPVPAAQPGFMADHLSLCEKMPLSAMAKNRPAKVPAHEFRDRFYDLLTEGCSFHDAVDLSLERKYDVVLWGNWSEKNYGSELTYYALYRVLRRMGKHVLLTERPKDASWGPNDTPVLFRKCPYPAYACFVPESRADMAQLNACSDTFMTGSDQIWHHDLYDSFGQVCYLEFADSSRRKIAYASSFGREYWDGDAHDIARTSFLLQQFTAVSVREKSGAKLCRDLFHVKADPVLDPVFLARGEIEELAEGSILKKDHYIGVYVLDRFNEFERTLSQIESALERPAQIILDAFEQEVQEACTHEILTGASVEDWVCNILHADYVITDSFHGMCLSILFRKPFAAISNEKRGATRFRELLSLLHLEDRLTDDPEDTGSILRILQTPVDYDAVAAILNAEAERSQAWLAQALSLPLPVSSYDQSDFVREQLLTDETLAHEEKKEVRRIQDWHTGRLDHHDEIQQWHTGRLDETEKITKWHTKRLDGMDKIQQWHTGRLDSMEKIDQWHTDRLDGHDKIQQWHTDRLDGHDKIQQWHTERLDNHDKIQQWHTDRLEAVEKARDEHSEQIEALQNEVSSLKEQLAAMQQKLEEMEERQKKRFFH